MKEKNLKYIKGFSKISVGSICEKLKISRSNVYNGRTSDENLEKVKEQIESEIAKLYIKGDK